MIDLDHWLTGRYRIPSSAGESLDDESDSVPSDSNGPEAGVE